MKIPFPYGLFRPCHYAGYQHQDLVAPLMGVLILAILAIVPIIQVGGMMVGGLAFLASGVVMLHLRYLAFVVAGGSEKRISPSAVSSTEGMAFIFQFVVVLVCWGIFHDIPK